MAADAEGPAREHRTVTRVTTILEAVAANPDGLTLAALAVELDAPKSSVHGLVKGLVATGYLRERAGTYTLGGALAALLTPTSPTLETLAHPVMERLSAEFDETVMLGTLVGDSVVYIDAVESGQLIRYSAPMHVRRPLYPTSTGKCFLAHLSARRRDAYLESHIPAHRRNAVQDELVQIRSEGYAINRGETLPDISAAGSPILVADRVLACLAVAGPTTRMADHLDQVGIVVRDAGRELSEMLS
jgi:DNA-binding IclR family transcriptional regulator